MCNFAGGFSKYGGTETTLASWIEKILRVEINGAEPEKPDE